MKRLLISAVLILIVIVAGIIWWENGNLPVKRNSKEQKLFIIKPGENVREIAYNLKTQGLIRDPIVFFLVTRFNGLDKRIQAGDFRLSPSMNLTQVTQNLMHGTLDIWVTVPEGKRADEIADILQKKMPEYQESWRKILEENEGYLFPDTYLFAKNSSIDDIVTKMRNNFDTQYSTVKDTKTTNLTDEQTVILASIVEREAAYEEDRPLAAAVFLNRFNNGISFGSDPTIQYALGYQKDTKTWWKKDLTVDDLAINSPYNTREHVGFPPGPISNPGLSALKAALNPAKTNYLFFFADKTGHLHFATTLQGHNANIQKYGTD